MSLPVFIVLGLTLFGILWWIPKLQATRSHGIGPDYRFDRENEARKTLAQIIGGGLVFAGIYTSLQTYDLQRQSQITDRFTKAIDQLGSVKASTAGQKPEINVEIRIGGVYALERIAYDSPRDHWPIMNVLSNYVRVNPPISSQTKSSPEIETILTVIGRRDTKQDPPGDRIDLTGSHFFGPSVNDANLIECILLNANLTDVDFSGSKLNDADFDGATLNQVDLSGTDLSGASFNGAKLDQETNLKDATLSETDLENAVFGNVIIEHTDFSNANLKGTDIGGADFSGALSLTQQQLNEAKGNGSTRLPNGLHPPATWAK